VLPAGVKAFNLAAAQRDSVLEFEFFNEAGQGTGPTNEMYALVCARLWKLPLWHNEKSRGLFPSAAAHGTLLKADDKDALNVQEDDVYKLLGMVVARAILDSRVVDLPLSSLLWDSIMGRGFAVLLQERESEDEQMGSAGSEADRVSDTDDLAVQYMRALDPSLIRSLLNLKSTAESELPGLCIPFVVPGLDVDLAPGRTVCTYADVDWYIRKASMYLLCSPQVRKRLELVRKGFDAVLPDFPRTLFADDELEQMLCGTESDGLWDVQSLFECVRLDHGYTAASPVVRYLFEALCELSRDEQRLFLKFLTGSPRLPLGGLRALDPRLTVVRKVVDEGRTADSVLPSVMTCQHYLKLPEYSSKDVLVARLRLAIQEGQDAFALS
jgi:E3 ubiquitin-protein ligase TRIP12